MANLKSFTCGPIATNAFVIADDEGVTAIIDPAPGSLAPIENYVNKHNLKVVKILITHSHWDHIADCAEAKRRFQAPVLVHAEDSGNLINPGSDGLPIAWDRPIEGIHPDQLLADGDRINIGQLHIEVIHTPGHCPGQVCFYLSKENILFSGDHFFHNAIGTLALPTAQPERMWPSLEKIGQLPPDTKVYPGHGPATTIGAETWLLKAKELGEESWFPKFED